MINKDKKILSLKGIKGFTLAEILITLTIIGVIAVLTMPTLMSKIQKNIIKVQYKQKVSLIRQALKMSEGKIGWKPNCFYWQNSPYSDLGAHCIGYSDEGNCLGYKDKDDGNLPSDYNGLMNECNLLKNTMMQSLKVVKRCPNKAYENGCIPAYKGIDTVYRNGKSEEELSTYSVNVATSGCGGWRENSIKNDREAWVLADGTIILFYSGFQLFAVDVNGASGPNKWGHDIFAFQVKSNDNLPLILAGGGCARVEAGGTNFATMLNNAFIKK